MKVQIVLELHDEHVDAKDLSGMTEQAFEDLTRALGSFGDLDSIEKVDE